MARSNSKDDFDLGDEDDSEDVNPFQDEINNLREQIFLLEKILRDNGLQSEVDKVKVSDEEIICLKGIASIRLLVSNGTFQKSDIQTFEILYNTLNTIKGVKAVKKEKPKSKAELLKLISK